MFATLTLAEQPSATLVPIPTVHARSADDLRTAVRLARHQTVHVDGRGLDRVLRVDADAAHVEAQAATRWSALAEILARAGHQAEALQRGDESPWPTLADAIAAAAPGPDGIPLGRHLVSLTMVLPDGELTRVDREGHPALFDLLLGGQGSAGVLYSATLSVPSLLAACAAASAPEAIEFPAPAGRPGRMEVLVPPQRTGAFIDALRELSAERRIGLGAVIVRRYTAGPCGMLGWATRDWAGMEVRYALRPTLGAEVTRTEFRRELLRTAVGLGGSFWLADAADATRDALLACYPRLPAFLAGKKRLDPAGRLQTRWSRELREKLRAP